MRRILLPTLALLTLSAGAQLNIQSGATFFIDAGAVVTVQGDVTSNANITGTGKLQMKGTAAQNINMNGNTVPNLQIDNNNHVNMTGAATVSGLLEFTAGKIILGANNLTLGLSSSVAGAQTGRFAETNGTGEVRRLVNAAGTYVLPVGNGSNYNPVSINIAGSTFSSAFVGGRARGVAHPNKHPRSTDFLTTYWSLNRSGVTGGTVTATATYIDGGGGQVTGTEDPNIRALTFDGTNWALGTGQNYAANTVTANMSTGTSDLYGMNRFLLVNAKALLQGAFDPATGLMRDALRSTDATQTGGTPTLTNIIPLNDPYRTADYSGNFIHVNNTVPESIAASVLNHNATAGNNIVDWVFLQLRSISSATNAPTIQTRSALVQRDGDIVDIDGVSPVYFKDVDAGNYVIAVRHRNHAGISTNPTAPLALGLTPASFDFTTAAAGNLFGTAGAAYTQLGAPLRNVMWGGNASGNAIIRFFGSNGPGPQNASDRDAILADIGGGQSTIITGQYKKADVNMNRITRFIGNNGPGVQNTSDRDWLLSQALGGAQGNIRTQSLPGN